MSIDQEVLSYLVTGGIALGVAGPLIALLVYYVKDINRLREARADKRLKPHTQHH